MSGAEGRERPDDLEGLRRAIGGLDAELIELLARRFRLVDRLSAVKRTEGAPVEDLAREKALCELYERISRREGLDPETAKRIFHAVFRESKARQRAALGLPAEVRAPERGEGGPHSGRYPAPDAG